MILHLWGYYAFCDYCMDEKSSDSVTEFKILYKRERKQEKLDGFDQNLSTTSNWVAKKINEKWKST